MATSAQASAASRRHWRLLRHWTFGLIGVWSLLTFVGIFFARDLRFAMFGWPFGFWLAAQGAVIGYVAIVTMYAIVAGRLDRAWQAESADRCEG